MKGLLQSCILNHRKSKRLETLWPRILAEMVQGYVRDMTNFDNFIENSLENV